MSSGLIFHFGSEEILSRFLRGKLKLVCTVLSVLCVVWIVDYSFQWIRLPIHLDHNPATVTLLSKATSFKQPIFFSGVEGDINFLAYGSYAYLFGSILIPFFENPFTADKVTATILFWSSVIMMSLLFIKRLGTNAGSTAILVFIFFLVCLIPQRFELKETAILFGTAVAFFSGFNVRNSLLAMILAGFGLAVCAVVNASQARISLIILLPLIIRERGIKWNVGAGAIFLVFGLGVFLHPSFSLEGQVKLLQFNSEVYFTDFWDKDKRFPVIVGSLAMAVIAGALMTREKFVLASAIMSVIIFPILLYSSSLWGTGTDKMCYLIPPLLILAGEPSVWKGMKKGRTHIVL